MNAEQLDRKLRAIAAPVKELDREYAEVMNSIRPRLDSIKAAMDVARAESYAAIEKLWLEVTYEDLCDPLTYQLVSEMVWNTIAPEVEAKHIQGTLLPDTYVQKYLSWYGFGNPLMGFEVAIPAKADHEKLERTAKLLEPLIRAATENDDRARFSVIEDDLSLHGSYYLSYDPEEKLFHLEGVRAYEHEELFEVLKRTPTYY